MQESRITNYELRITKAMLRRRLLVSCFLFLFFSLACQTLAPTATPTPVGPVATSAKKGSPDSPVMADRHHRIFQSVWRTVKRYYLYDDYNGTDWNAIQDEFAPLVADVSDDETFWLLMYMMIERLNDQHSIFLTPEEVAIEDQMVSGDLDYVGIGVYLSVPENAEYGVVLYTLPHSPAERAGIRAHDRIVAVDGQPACCNNDGSDNLYLLQGPSGTSVTLNLQYPGETARTVEVERAHIQTQVPVIQRRLEAENQDVGYLLIPTLWDETIAERTRETLTDMLADSTLPGLIIDMRVNGGGAFTELYDLLSLFTTGDVGYFHRRGMKDVPLTIEPDPIHNSQDIPLVILIGRDTESYAEIFSGALQQIGRATLVGDYTAGNVETVYPYDLEDGSRLWLAEESFIPPSGTRWEGQGVKPDVFVKAQWEDVNERNDPHIEAALSLIPRK
jgi:carboxyl-terminal processing protease